MTFRSYGIAGVRRLGHRLRQGSRILSPAPGAAAEELAFRDATGADVRVRRPAGHSTVLSERNVRGRWLPESSLVEDDRATGRPPGSGAVDIPGCLAIRFAVTPEGCAVITATLEDGERQEALLLVAKPGGVSLECGTPP